MRARLVLSLFAGTLVAGCASTSPKASYADVAKLVEERGGHAPPWDQHTPEDAEVEARVRALVAGELTSDAAVEVALLRNRKLQAVYQSVGVAQADLVQAGLLRNPTLGGSIGFPLAGSPYTELQGSITQDFLDLFTLPLRSRIAGIQLEQAKLQVGSAVLELGAEVRTAYLRVQAAQQMSELRRTIVEAEGTSAELSERQFHAGNISELERVNRRAVYEQARLDLARAENEVLEAREALTRLMGVWGHETDWKITATLPELPAREPAFEHLEAAAIRQRLDLGAARAETESLAQAAQLAAGTRFLGNVEVGGSVARDSEGNKVAGPSVNLELPIFDQHQARIARLEAQVREARAREDGLAIDIRSEVRSARNRILAARAVVEHYRSTLLPLRERVVQLSQEQYNAMLLGVFGLLQAKQSEITAYRDYIESIRDYWIARVELERAVGGRLPSAGSQPASENSLPAREAQAPRAATESSRP